MVEAQLSTEIIETIQNKLLKWFDKNGRLLPWRVHYRPYHVWISEIMLQQTQMERGAEYFLRWIGRFPDVWAVAEADEQEILKYWEGLGYYARARNLHKAARKIVDDYSGELPESYQELLTLPGVGPYTAAAVSSIAYNLGYAVVDANVERVYSRLFDIASPLKEKATKLKIQQNSKEILPEGKARLFNQALMDFGAMVCTPKSPDCNNCVICSICLSFRNKTVNNRPVKGKKKEQVEMEMVSAIIVHHQQLFIQQRLAEDVWGGLWEFPGGKVAENESVIQALIRRIKEETEWCITPGKELEKVIHYYTKYKVLLSCFVCELDEPKKLTKSPRPTALHAAQQCRWVNFSELDLYAFSSGHRKIIEYLKKDGGMKLLSFQER